MSKQHKWIFKISTICWVATLTILTAFCTYTTIDNLQTQNTKLVQLNKDLTLSNLSKRVDINILTQKMSDSISNYESQISDLTNTISDLNNRLDVVIECLKPLKSSDPILYLQMYKKLSTDYITYHKYMSVDEYNLFCRVVQAEIGGGSFKAKCDVASVITNRLNNNYFPNNIKDVLMANDPIGGYQFTSIENGAYLTVKVDKETKQAIDYVLNFGDTTDGCYYFYANTSYSDWHENNLQYVFTDGYHRFFKFKK